MLWFILGWLSLDILTNCLIVSNLYFYFKLLFLIRLLLLELFGYMRLLLDYTFSKIKLNGLQSLFVVICSMCANIYFSLTLWIIEVKFRLLLKHFSFFGTRQRGHPRSNYDLFHSNSLIIHFYTFRHFLSKVWLFI